jgi:hypothetical protein
MSRGPAPWTGKSHEEIPDVEIPDAEIPDAELS